MESKVDQIMIISFSAHVMTNQSLEKFELSQV